jgi:dTDP-4-dehydrorhamnose reductase
MVFDGRTGMYTETDPLSPLSVYGYTKAFAEKAILDTCPNSVVVRSALIYGDPNPGGGSFTVWLKHRLQSQQQAPLYTDQYRTPILVNNLARAIVELSENEMTGIVHFGGANRINRYEFGKQFCQVMGYSDRYLHPILMKEHQMTAPRPADVSLSIQKACSQLKTEFLDTKEGLMEMKTMLD